MVGRVAQAQALVLRLQVGRALLLGLPLVARKPDPVVLVVEALVVPRLTPSN